MHLDQTLDAHAEPTGRSTAIADEHGDRELTARDLAIAIGAFSLDEVRARHHELVVAVADLAAAAGQNWPWGHDDPTVAVLRALAKLSIDAPDAASRHATALQQALETSR